MTYCQKHQAKVQFFNDNFYFKCKFKSLIHNEQILDVPAFNVHR
jgi:hypothetical protein